MAPKKENARNKRPQKAKTGRKDSKAKVAQDIKLRQLYSRDGITPWAASNEVNCGYEYAVKKFKEFGQELTEAEDENWIERQDKVRKRALEGLTIQIKYADNQIKGIENRLKKSVDMQGMLLDSLINNVEDSELGDILKETLGRVDAKVAMAIYKQLANDINMWKNYGYLVETTQATLNREIIFKAELQMQYDGIEIMPPPSAVLEAEIEKSIAAKNELFSVKIPQPEVKTK